MFNKPRVILCDEPTGSLDRDTGLQILELFQDLSASEGLTMIVVTHEEHISRMASRIVRLEDGALASDTPNEPVKAR
jgi:putative ABC transport system ATP-binding protein